MRALGLWALVPHRYSSAYWTYVSVRMERCYFRGRVGGSIAMLGRGRGGRAGGLGLGALAVTSD